MVENIANKIAVRILTDMKNRYQNSTLNFDSLSQKNSHFKELVIMELTNSAITLKFLMTLSPANSEGLSGRDLSIMANDIVVLTSNLISFPESNLDTLFGLLDKNNSLTLLELLDTAKRV